MINTVKSILLFLGTTFISWWIAEVLLYLDFLLHPYTHLGYLVRTYVLHSVFIILCAVWCTLYYLEGAEKKR